MPNQSTLPLGPGLCPINPATNRRECPPATEIVCVVVEKVFDQCFKEDHIFRSFVIPTGPGEPCENVDLDRVDRVECEVDTATCEIVGVGDPDEETNIANVNLVQQVTMTIELWDDTTTPGTPILLCQFCATIDNFFNSVQLYVPPPGALFGPEGGPFAFCEVVSVRCSCDDDLVTDPATGLPAVFCKVDVCKIIQINAFVKLLVHANGYCVPGPCEPREQPPFQCPPEELFPPQPDIYLDIEPPSLP